jgi:hypothetical protein
VRVEKSSDPIENNKYNIAIYFNQISKSDMKLVDRYVKHCVENAALDTAPRIQL